MVVTPFGIVLDVTIAEAIATAGVMRAGMGWFMRMQRKSCLCLAGVLVVLVTTTVRRESDPMKDSKIRKCALGRDTQAVKKAKAGTSGNLVPLRRVKCLARLKEEDVGRV